MYKSNFLHTYLDDIDGDNGHDIAIHLSIDIAINVLTDAETETPCKYDTALQKNAPRNQAGKNQLILFVGAFIFFFKFYFQTRRIKNYWYPEFQRKIRFKTFLEDPDISFAR